MSNGRKGIEELNLLDDFMFNEAAMDTATANLLVKLVIERATGLKVHRLVIESQKQINGINTKNHGIRLDVSVSEVELRGKKEEIVRLYDIEPNKVKKVQLSKRSRFYQSLIDVKLLDSGVDYDKLPELWSIWILDYDPFDKNQMIYTVKNIVEGFEEIEYNDGVRKFFLYTEGEAGGSVALGNLLKYIKSSQEENAVDSELKELHSNVARIKSSEKFEVKYMQMQEVLKYVREDERVLVLISQLQKKYQKGKSLEAAAEEVEEKPEDIRLLYEVVTQYPQEEPDEVLKKYRAVEPKGW